MSDYNIVVIEFESSFSIMFTFGLIPLGKVRTHLSLQYWYNFCIFSKAAYSWINIVSCHLKTKYTCHILNYNCILKKKNVVHFQENVLKSLTQIKKNFGNFIFKVFYVYIHKNIHKHLSYRKIYKQCLKKWKGERKTVPKIKKTNFFKSRH